MFLYMYVYVYISPSLHGSTRSTSRYLRSHSQVTCLELDSAIIESLGMAQKKGTGNWEPLFFFPISSLYIKCQAFVWYCWLIMANPTNMAMETPQFVDVFPYDSKLTLGTSTSPVSSA